MDEQVMFINFIFTSKFYSFKLKIDEILVHKHFPSSTLKKYQKSNFVKTEICDKAWAQFTITEYSTRTTFTNEENMFKI